MFLGVEGVPLPPAPATDATSSGSHKNANSHATKNKHDSTVYHTTKKHISNEENTGDGRIKKSHAQKISEGSTTQKPSKQKDHSNSALMFKEQRTAKTSVPTNSKDLNLPLDSDSKSELVKRDLQINIFPSQSGSIDKPVEIEVKSYASPPNTSAVIEVNPKTYNVDFHNSPDGNLWPEYQMNQYPQETNGPLNWYTDNYQQPVPPSLSYVPTEELLHSQNFLNIPSLGSQVLYQYPVKDAIYRNPINPLRPKLNHVQETSKPLNNNEGSSKQNSEREYMLTNYPVNLQLQNLAYNPNTLQQFPYVLPTILPSTVKRNSKHPPLEHWNRIELQSRIY